MSDQTPRSNSQTLVIALAVVAVLLAALVGVLIYQQSQAAKVATLSSAPTAATNGTQTPPAGMTGQASGATTPFDAKTATKVPSGTTPEQLVKAYNEAVIAGKYDAAYKMLPLDKQKSYGDPASYAAQLKQYGINGYKMGKPVTTGDSVSIVAEQDNPSMPITYTWNFKKVGGVWYVESRVMGGSVQ